MNFQQEDIRKLIYFEWQKGLSCRNIHKQINNTLGNNTVSLRLCQKWVKKFNDGCVDTTDGKRSGRPSLDIDDEILQYLEEHRHATTREIANALDVSHETVWNKLKEMGKQYLHNIWVPHTLNENQKASRVTICTSLLTMIQRDNFLNRIVTGDEIWILWENEGVSNTHRCWRGSGDEPMTESKRKLTTKKHLATIFWDSKGILLIDVLPRNSNMTSIYYCQVLDRLKGALQIKRRRMMQGDISNIRLLHDNATPHSALITRTKLTELGFSVLPHPPYSPDLAPSDFYLFSPLKSHLRGKNFNTADEASIAIQEWADSKPAAFFLEGIYKLPNRWQKCIDNGGNYFEHLY